MSKPIIKSPRAKLSDDGRKITIMNIDYHAINDFWLDLIITMQGALKRFRNSDQRNCYYLLDEVFTTVQKQVLRKKPYYSISLTIPQSHYVVKHFSTIEVSNNTIEIYSLLDQILPVCQELRH